MVPLNLALYVVTGCWSQWKGCIAVLKSYRDIGLLIGMRLRGWGVLVTDWVTLANEKFYFWFIWLNQAVKGLELWVIFDHECNVGPISICLYVTGISNRQTGWKLQQGTELMDKLTDRNKPKTLSYRCVFEKCSKCTLFLKI